MVALVTLGILILIQTIPLIHYLHYLMELIRMNNAGVRLCSDWILLFLLVLVILRCRLTVYMCGRRAPEPSTAGPIVVTSMVMHIVTSGLFVVIPVWLRRAGNPIGLI